MLVLLIVLVLALRDGSGDGGAATAQTGATTTTGPSAEETERATQAARDAFGEAIDRLAAAPYLEYQMSDVGSEVEVRVTSSGHAIGSMSLASYDMDVLLVEDTTYLKAPDGLLPDAPAELPAAELEDRYVSTSSSDGPSLPQLGPATLAEQLHLELERADLAPLDDLATDVGTTPALRVESPEVELFVSADAPHTVLRIVPASLPDPAPDAGPPELALEPLFLDGIDLTVPDPDDPATADELAALYQEIIGQAQSLDQAVDGNVIIDDLVLTDVSCPGECRDDPVTVTADVTNRVIGTADTEILVEMDARIDVDGQEGGTCSTGPTPVEPNATSTLSCSSPAAGDLADSLLSEKEASAGPGQQVEVLFEAEAVILAFAATAEELDQLLAGLETELTEALSAL